MKRKLLLSILAAFSVVLLPLAASSQIVSEYEEASSVRSVPSVKYELFAGYGYTSLNQVEQSRRGLQGINVSVTRDWGKYLGLTADGGYYPSTLGSGNPGSPSVDVILAGPVLHAHLFWRLDFFVRGLLGVEHTGGEAGGTPVVSFAGGPGAGMDYQFRPHLSLRLLGDDIISSYVEDPNHLGYSPHEYSNSRLSIGLVYKF
ncbi:MAG: hypothetical protein ACP5FH_11050 [Terracidiphilus sp.]